MLHPLNPDSEEEILTLIALPCSLVECGKVFLEEIWKGHEIGRGERFAQTQDDLELRERQRRLFFFKTADALRKVVVDARDVVVRDPDMQLVPPLFPRGIDGLGIARCGLFSFRLLHECQNFLPHRRKLLVYIDAFKDGGSQQQQACDQNAYE